MPAFAAVMTGPGLGAIATIQLCGDVAEAVLRNVLRRKGGKPFDLVAGRIVLGHVVDNGEMVDEVTVGCEGPHIFAIHCHGNPLIVNAIMELLRQHGAEVLSAEQLLARTLASPGTRGAIALEAKLALATVKTMAGAAILSNQMRAGLSGRIRQWQDRFDSTPLEEIAAEAGDILQRSEPARLIISGCTIALVGPPNTGKSTLLNTLAGREKALVSDIRGTTRDWISAEIHLPPLAAAVIDTAGLDLPLATADGVDHVAQQKSIEILDRADVVLLILDAASPADQLCPTEEIHHRGHREKMGWKEGEKSRRSEGESSRQPCSVLSFLSSLFSVSSVPSVANNPPSQVQSLWRRLAAKRTVVVLNKADLPSHLDPASLPSELGPMVRISAQQGSGIDELIRAIHHVCGVAAFDPHTPVAFTDRQRRLLEALLRSDSRVQARSLLAELLDSPACLGGRATCR